MKFITVLFSLVLAFTANAGLITNVSSSGNQVFVDFSVSDHEPDIFEIFADFNFDENQLEFVSYSDSDHITLGDNDINNDIAFGVADVIDPDLFQVSYFFLLPAFDQSFDLGQAVFNILPNTDVNQISFTELFVEAYDANFEFVDSFASEVNINVPEPSSLALFSLAAGLLLMRRKQLS